MKPLCLEALSIVRDEVDYLREWLCWHRRQGVARFLVADNGSIDGTRQLLEALEELGLVRLLYQVQEPNAQTRAYVRLLEAFGCEADVLVMLDADEFLVGEEGADPGATLQRLFARHRDCGGIAINWRLFGSGGQREAGPQPVIERFTRCAGDDHALNLFLKGVVRPEAVLEPRVHHCVLRDGFRYYDCRGEPVMFRDRLGRAVERPTGSSDRLCAGPLRVHHYAVKSLAEFVEKKQRKGDAVLGPQRVRSMQYFRDYDVNEASWRPPPQALRELEREMRALDDELQRLTRYNVPQGGEVLATDGRSVEGACWSADGQPARVVVAVNGLPVAEPALQPQPVAAGDSALARFSFACPLPAPLQQGQRLQVSFRANRCALDNAQQLWSGQ